MGDTSRWVRVPDARLVIQNVILQAAIRRRSESVDEVLHPSLLIVGVRGDIGVGRVVAGNVLAGARENPVARIRVPLRVVARLRAILRLGETRQLDRFVPSFATHPIIGMVSIGCAPARLLVEIKVSPRSPATALVSPILSKYQSCPRLSAFACQL